MRERGSQKQRRLSSTIFSSIFVFSIVIAICFSGAFSAFFYFAHEKEAEGDLLRIAEAAAASLNAGSNREKVDVLKSQFKSEIRYTLIGPDGQVLYDSRGDVSANHADRPEVKQAQERGVSSVVRYSETLGEDTIYAAVAMESGDIIRLSEQRTSYLAVLETILFPLVAALVLIALISLVLSRVLTRRIVAPLDEVDVSNPLSNETYVEMEPLLLRISEQKQQLMEQNQELSRAENMRREFSANVSHEMKTPLQVISGYTELIASGTVPNEDIRKFAGVMLKESQHMNALIDDILTLSRLDDPVHENAGKEELELLSLTKEVARRLVPVAESCEVRLRVFGSSVEFMGNRQLIAQIVTNLVSNAIRYSDAGGEVVVSVGKNLISDTGENVPEAFIKVKDSGCGISAVDQEKIFERFYRVDKGRSRESGGTGLGLAIAKHAAEFHGASISVESEPGHGSVFTVHFPL